MLKFHNEQSINTSLRLRHALDCLSVKVLKEGLSKMNRRVSGSLRKDEVVSAIAAFVLHDTESVWKELSRESRKIIRELVQAGKGKGLDVPNILKLEKSRELREMNLVIDCEVVKGVRQERNQTIKQMAFKLFLLDEVYDAFAALQKDKTEDGITEDSTSLELPEDSLDFEGRYCCSIDQVKDVRALQYKKKAKILKLFHKELLRHEFWYHSFFGIRFEETFCNIHFRNGEIDIDDESLSWLGYAENDFDNIISAIDDDDPMTFFAIARKMEKEM